MRNIEMVQYRRRASVLSAVSPVWLFAVLLLQASPSFQYEGNVVTRNNRLPEWVQLIQRGLRLPWKQSFQKRVSMHQTSCPFLDPMCGNLVMDCHSCHVPLHLFITSSSFAMQPYIYMAHDSSLPYLLLAPPLLLSDLCS